MRLPSRSMLDKLGNTECKDVENKWLVVSRYHFIYKLLNFLWNTNYGLIWLEEKAGGSKWVESFTHETKHALKPDQRRGLE